MARIDITKTELVWPGKYNEESFFVRHAYFTGTDEPYDKLQRALRANIDEAAWASLTAPAAPSPSLLAANAVISSR